MSLNGFCPLTAFRYRDRADNDTEKTISISAEAFIGRFLLHILPEGVQKIRFYGWMARTVRTHNLRRIREALGVPPPARQPSLPARGPACPSCGQTSLLWLGPIGQARAPPTTL